MSGRWKGKSESDPMVSEGMKTVPRFLTSWLEKSKDSFKLEETEPQLPTLSWVYPSFYVPLVLWVDFYKEGWMLSPLFLKL